LVVMRLRITRMLLIPDQENWYAKQFSISHTLLAWTLHGITEETV